MTVRMIMKYSTESWSGVSFAIFWWWCRRGGPRHRSEDPSRFFLKGWKLGSTGAHLFQTDKRYRYFLPFSLAHQNIGEFENWTFLNSALTGPKSYILPDGVFEPGARQQKIRQTQQRWKSIALFWPHCHLQVRYYGYYFEEAAYQPVFSAGDVVLYQHFG